MKKFPAFVYLIFLTACSTEGVRERTTPNTETTTEAAKTSDSVKPVLIDSAYLVKNDGKNYAPEKINYDTAFNFSSLAPVEKRKTSSGLTIDVLSATTGEKIKKGEVVSLVYRGKLTNEKIIETSGSFGKPLPYYVGIAMTFDAFDEVITQCRYGEKVRFTIPAARAYGKTGHGTLIPPNSDLVYELHIAGPTRPTEPEEGLRIYRIIDKPLARSVKPTDKITLGYMAWTDRGKLFDASVFRGKDADVDLTNTTVIKGWKSSLTQLHEGEKALVCVPAAMAYGAKGIPEMVPPNSNLVYILEIKKVN